MRTNAPPVTQCEGPLDLASPDDLGPAFHLLAMAEISTLPTTNEGVEQWSDAETLNYGGSSAYCIHKLYRVFLGLETALYRLP